MVSLFKINFKFIYVINILIENLKCNETNVKVFFYFSGTKYVEKDLFCIYSLSKSYFFTTSLRFTK